MEKDEKIAVAYLISLAIVIPLGIIYVNYSIGNPIFPDKITKSASIERIVEAPIHEIFDVMANVQNLPTIFPGNYISIKIINQTKNTIFTEEEVGIEIGSLFKTKILVKHSFIPYEKHNIEVLNGDANGTKVVIYYEEIDPGKTKILVNSDIQLHGLFVPLGMITTQNNIEHMMNTVIRTFEEFIQNNMDD